MPRHRAPATLAALAVGALALVLACGLGGAVVRAGFITPPDVDLNLGPLRLIGRVSTIPLCSQLISPDCVLDPGRPPPRHRVYTLWLFSRTTPGTWDRPDVRRVLTVQIEAAR